MKRSRPQSKRMEKELGTLRKLKADAYKNEDPSRVITLTRVILQQEAAISKQRVHEGRTLDRDVIDRRRDELASKVVEVAKRWIPDKDTYDAFVDDLLVELGDLWG